MVATGYLLDFSMAENENEIVFLTIKVTRGLRQEFKAAAKVEEIDVSNALRRYMKGFVRDVKSRDTERFNETLKSIKDKGDDESDVPSSKKKKPSKRSGGKTSEQSYEVIPQTRLFSDGTGTPVAGKKLSRKILADIEDATNDAIERTRKKLSSPKG